MFEIMILFLPKLLVFPITVIYGILFKYNDF